jgi:hypothetical protein
MACAIEFSEDILRTVGHQQIVGGRGGALFLVTGNGFEADLNLVRWQNFVAEQAFTSRAVVRGC